MRYGMLADYYAEGQHGKPTIVGVWDVILHTDPAQPIVVPRSFLVASFDTSALEGSEHELELRLVDANGSPAVEDSPRIQVGFKARGPDRPMRADFALELVDLQLPSPGDYQFQFWNGSDYIGTVDLHVVLVPAAP